MNHRKDIRRNTITLTLIAATGALPIIGCESCGDKARDLRATWKDFYDQRWACCQKLMDLGANREAAECFEKLEQDAADTGSMITSWQVACENENSDRMEFIEQLILNMTSPGCLGALIASNGSETANISSPIEHLDDVSIDLKPLPSRAPQPVESEAAENALHDAGRIGTTGNRFRGTVCIGDDAGLLCGTGKGRIRYVPMPLQQGTHVRNYRPTFFELIVRTGDLTTTLGLVEHERNRITIDRNGQGTLKVATTYDTSAPIGVINDVVWFEFPVRMTLDGIAIRCENLSGLDLAPEKPNAIADWNGDWIVNDVDYVLFLEDFIDGRTDLNLDGTVDGEDMKYFMERWENSF